MDSDRHSLERLEERANLGSVAARLELALYLISGEALDGQPIPLDVARAQQLLIACHEAGSLTGTVQLAMTYLRWSLPGQDVKRAISLLEQAAARGSFVACIELARIYRAEANELVSRQSAQRWYQRALELGDDIDLVDDLNEARAFLLQARD
jgi:TPR repeat protein